MTDEQIEAALNVCIFGQTKETRYKDCPLDSDKEPCITNLHLAALEYIGRLKHRAEVAENELKLYKLAVKIWQERYSDIRCFNFNIALSQAEKELAEEGDDD